LDVEADYLEKGQQHCAFAFSFSLKLNIFRLQQPSATAAVSFFLLCFFMLYTCCPIQAVTVSIPISIPVSFRGLVSPSNGRTAHQIYFCTINFNFWPASNAIEFSIEIWFGI